MDLLSQFGFDWKLFLAQIVNFLIIAYLFKRFLYGPILSTLKKREDTIDKGLRDAEKAEKELAKAETERDSILEKAGKEAAKMLEEAEKAAEEAREKILNDTRIESEKIMHQTREQMILERDLLVKEAQNMSLVLSKKILEESIKGMFDEKTQKDLIKKSLPKIKNV